MMWNFLVHGLSVGCTLVLYDGSPLKDPSLLWTLVDKLGITIFGTSAKYIDQLSVSARIALASSTSHEPRIQKCYKHPKAHHNLSTLRHIYSTGSPLAAPLFDFVYEEISSNVILGSITGIRSSTVVRWPAPLTPSLFQAVRTSALSLRE